MLHFLSHIFVPIPLKKQKKNVLPMKSSLVLTLSVVVVCGGFLLNLSAQAQETLLFGLPNCQELVPGILNLHWELSEDGTVIDFALEGIVPEGNQYMAFGFSPPDAPSAVMVGSQVVIAGNVGEDFFGNNYLLTEYQSCNAGLGVCQESSQDIEVVDAERSSNGMAIHMKRGIGDWPVDGSQVSIWAMGAVGDDSSVALPDIQYHGTKRSAPGSSTTVTFNTPSNTCSKIV